MKPIRYYVIGGITAGLLTCVAVNTSAQTAGVPRQISYQGVLHQGDKVSPDGMYSVTLALYDKATGGQPLWQETQTVEVKGGLFNIILGQYVPLSAPLPTDAWVGISFNSMGEMPRTKLTSVPYAFNAVTAQSLMPNATGAVLSLNGQQGAIELRATDGFEVRSDKGVLTIGKTSSAKEDEILNDGTEWLLAGNGNANANSWLGTSNNIPLIIRTNNTERMRILSSNGNVGIGETNPASRLSVARTLHITNSGGTPELKLSAPSGANSTTFKTTGQSANITYTLPPDDGDANEVLISNGSGVLTWTDNGWLRDGNSDITSSKFIGTTNNQPFIVKTNNVERYRVTGNGAMGINEDNPTQKLEVAGNILIKVDANNTGELRFQEPPGFMGNNYVGLKAGSVVNNIVFTLPSAYPSEPGQVLSAGPTGVMTWITPDGGGSGSGLLYFAESRHTSSPNDIIPTHRFAAIGADNDIDVAFSPKGYGALMAQLPDNTNAGGDKRGDNAVDWQMSRFSSDQVAGAPYSVIGGGEANRVDGIYSVISGGVSNRIDGDASTIGGGFNNFIGFDTEGGVIAGGSFNQLGGDESGTTFSSILGGTNNELYGNNSTILGGQGLILEGSGSFGFNANRFATEPVEEYDRNMSVNASNTGVLNNIDLWLTNNDNTPRTLRFYEAYNQEGTFPNGANYAAFRAAETMASNVTWTLPDADGSSGQVLSTNGSGLLSWVTAGGGLQYFTENRNTTAPNATVPVHQFVASGAETNIDIALTPKGNGALTAHRADGTNAGGNKRGIHAVDWQRERSANTQVASGSHSVISGGYANTANEYMSAIGGGEENTADGAWSAISGGYLNSVTDQLGTIGGGYSNSVTDQYGTVGGGHSNNVTDQAGTIGGGYLNSVTVQYGTVGGGYFNRVTNQAGTISGGNQNIASGFEASVGGGLQNFASGHRSTISGGEGDTTAGDYSAIPGGRGLTLDANADRSFGFHGNTTAGDRNMTISAANTAVLGNVDLWRANNDNTPRSLRFYEQYNTAGAYPNGSNYVGFRAPNSIAADVTWTLPDADGTSGQVLSTDGSGILSWTNAGSGLQYFTEARNTTAPNDIVPVHQFAATGTGTDIDIALTPKGTGALTAQIADETAAGGDKRGLYAVDWQMQRTTQAQVASGDNSVISGGNANDARGEFSVVGGGNSNRNDGPASVIAGGNGNFIGFDAENAGILGGNANRVGGNEAGSNNSAVVGGSNNEVYGNNSTILGGRGLTLNGSGNVGFLGNNTTGANDMVVTASNTAAFANVDLWIVNNDNTAHTLRIYEASGSGSNYTAFRAAAQTTNVTYTLPPGDGADGQTLTTNGAGQLSWRDAIPCGSIIMWTGDIDNVPTGWALCDGTGGTPDLNDRFPRGTTNAASVGTTGGSDDHSHTVNDHDHTLSSVTASGTIDDGTVSGSIGTNTTSITASGSIDSGIDITTDGTTNNYSSNVTINVNDPGHDHSFIGGLVTTSVAVNVSGSTDTASGVGTTSESNVPAYVYVGYIMKVCPVTP
ncbi:MAG: hypothetical protein J0M05_01050 [Candidatus Kapabacteria bacterium]|nr:hypothetical protein [Candidatus Kapabacteria bacterium]